MAPKPTAEEGTEEEPITFVIEIQATETFAAVQIKLGFARVATKTRDRSTGRWGGSSTTNLWGTSNPF